MLYLESHVQVSSNMPEDQGKNAQLSPEAAIDEVIKGRPIKVDWQKVSQVVMQQIGIPEPISEKN